MSDFKWPAAANATISLTGDVTGSGTGSIATTLATVNSNVGSFTLTNITVNAKGLVTAAASPPTTGAGNIVLSTSPTITGSINGSAAVFSGSISAANLSGTNTGDETIGARYFASATVLSGSLATISWTTQDYDSNSAMSSGVYTIPRAGRYQINSGLLIAGTIALNNQAVMEIQKNGSVISRETLFFPAALTDGKISISDIINCALSDTIRIQVSTAITGPSIVSSNFDNYISIARLGT